MHGTMNIKFNENLSIGSRVVFMGMEGRTDRLTEGRYDEANNRSSQFCECA
jgi:hypothetical protein